MNDDLVARGKAIFESRKYEPKVATAVATSEPDAACNGWEYAEDIPPPPEPPDDDTAEYRQTTDHNSRQFAVTTLSDVVPEKVSWLWSGRLPLGKLVTLDGDPGVGKSTLALTFAAVTTTGGRWPDGTYCEHPGDVILMSAEDGLADTIRPRLDAAGADVSRVHAVQGVPLDGEGEALRMATLADVEMLRNLITQTHARLVIVDVLMAYVPTGTDSHRDQDVRQVLARLAALAAATGCTIVLLRHLNKGKGDPMYRGGGSIGIIGAARVGLLVAPDPDDEDRRVLASVKNNLAPEPPSLAYRLLTDELYDVARVEWVGVSEHDARALLAERDNGLQTAGDEAADWLQDYLTVNGRVRSSEVKAAASKEGHSRATIERAGSKLRLVIQSEGFPRVTFWTLPPSRQSSRPQSPQSPQSPQPMGPEVAQSPPPPELEVTEVTEVTGAVSCQRCGTRLLATASTERGTCLECHIASKPEGGS